nr:sulfite exporter TauE/SafE family protein [Candidatus Njordarchaeum guaymaensis]
MYFPISGADVSIEMILLLGFASGVMAGFLGVGGGWIITPTLSILGLPIHFAVGSSLCYVAGNSIPGIVTHRRLGHIDLKLSGLMIAGTAIGVELGVRMIEYLKLIGETEMTVSISLIILMYSISAYALLNTLRARAKGKREKRLSLSTSVVERLRVTVPPTISLPTSGIESVSVWWIFMVASLTGFSAGLTGIGGGLLAIPALIYVIGAPPGVAIGTSLLPILFAASYGTFSHALRGNVDITVALAMLPTGALGSELGSHATKHFARNRGALGLVFGFSIFMAACAELLKILKMTVFAFAILATMVALVTGLVLLILIRETIH